MAAIRLGPATTLLSEAGPLSTMPCLFSRARRRDRCERMCVLLHEFPNAHRTYAGQPFDQTTFASTAFQGGDKANRATRTVGELRTANFSRGLRKAAASSNVSASSILARAIAR